MTYYVEIRLISGETVTRLGPYPTERAAERAERGVNINLNHSGYYAVVVEESSDEHSDGLRVDTAGELC